MSNTIEAVHLLEVKLKSLLSNYDFLLKVAKTIEGSNNSTRDTKLKINALIREIDKCIVQLNE